MLKSAKLRWTMAGVGALAAVAIPLVAIAYPKYGWERVYYSDASHSQIVGEGTMYCNGRTFFPWGYSTPYFDETLVDCNDPPIENN